MPSPPPIRGAGFITGGVWFMTGVMGGWGAAIIEKGAPMPNEGGTVWGGAPPSKSERMAALLPPLVEEGGGGAEENRSSVKPEPPPG